MKINLETIQKLNPCQDRLDNYKNNYDTNDFTLEEFLNLDKITYTDKVWVATGLFTKKQNVLWSIKCAESVLHLFESLYPEDKRPRDAIEAAKAWTIKQDESASSAASSTGWFAAEKQQEELNLKFMLEVYNETKGE